MRASFTVFQDCVHVRHCGRLAIVRGAARDWLAAILPTAAALGELDALADSVFMPGHSDIRVATNWGAR